MEEIIDKVLKAVESRIVKQDKRPEFNNPEYKPVDFSKDNFHKIQPVLSKKKIAFVDGGNAEIIGSSNFSLQLIRTYHNVFSKNKKVKSNRQEFYSLTYAEDQEGDIVFKTDLFSSIIPKEDLVFDSFDKTLRTGEFRTVIQKIGEVVRAMAEVRLVEEIVKNKEADVIVLDGALECRTTNLDKYFDSLYKEAEKNNVNICALSKTVRMFTDSGNSVVSALHKIEPEGRWYYHPVCEINSKFHRANIYFLRLHENSEYIFKLEHYKAQKPEGDLFGILAANANDAVFLGYPYGLVDADQFARIPNREAELRKTGILARNSRLAKLLSEAMTSINAHGVLDRK